MPEQDTIGPETNLVNKLRLHLSAYNAGRKFLGTVDEATKLTELLGLGDLGNVNAAGTVTPFTTFARKSLDAEQGLTPFASLSRKFMDLLRGHYGEVPEDIAGNMSHYAKFLTENTPESTWTMPNNPELIDAATKYHNYLKNSKTLENLNLPHPSTDYYDLSKIEAKTSRGQELFDSFQGHMKSLLESHPEMSEEIQAILDQTPEAYKKGKVLTFKPKE